MRRTIARCLAVLALLCTRAARAEWLEASSDHFVITANSTEARLRDFATRLERFDAALRSIYGIADDPAKRANRVAIIAVGIPEVGKLAGNPNVRGFYLARAGQSVIFTSALMASRTSDAKTGSNLAPSAPSLDLDAQATLLHEYSHHFMYANFPRAYPTWFSEGFAEFNGNARFDPDGSVVIGLAPGYRAIGLYYGSQMSIRTILAPLPKKPIDADQFYGRSWLLVHYLMVEGNKQAALNRYLDALNAGKSSVDAAQLAFGDLDVLFAAANKLATSNRLGVLRTAAAAPPRITVTPLSAGAAAMMPVHIRSTAGVDPTAAAAVVTEAERIAAPFATDPRVQDALTEAEYDAGNDDKADAAAARALAADPQDIRAMLYRGRVGLRRFAKSKDAAQLKAARSAIVHANRAAPDAAEPLLFYYRSFLASGERPPAIAFDGLLRAQQLAPESGEIRLLIASQLIDGKKIDEARAMLQPLAYAPHGLAGQKRALDALTALDAAKPDAARDALRSTGD